MNPLFFFFNFILLYNPVLVLPYINMNLPQVYTCSPSWTSFPPPSPYHPSGSPQCTSPEHPVSCIKPGLAICFTYDITYVSMPFSQIIPPSPSPTESKRLFYTSASLLLLRGKNVQTRAFYSERLTFRIEGEIRNFSANQRLIEFINSKHTLHGIL